MRSTRITILTVLMATMSKSWARIDTDLTALSEDHTNGWDDVDVAIRSWAESVRVTMPLGDPEFGLPVLDPLSIHHYTTTVNLQLIKLQIAFDDLLVTGMSDFVLKTVRTDLESLQADLGIDFPQLDMSGRYSFQSDIEMVSGSGFFALSLGGVSTQFQVQLSVRNESVQVSRLDFDFSAETTQVGLENLTSGGASGAFVNHLLTVHKADVAACVSDAILQYVNPVLDRFSLPMLLEALGIHRP